MATVTLKNDITINTVSELPEVGEFATNFELVNNDLENITLESYKGKKVVLNIFPSVDTPTCAASARKFNEQASKLDNTKVVNISYDLPFALARFCAAEGLDNVDTLSCFRSSFADDYGVKMIDGPLKGLLARAVIILDETHKVKYTELVSEITNEPDYQSALDNI